MRLACFLFGEVRYGYVHKLCFFLPVISFVPLHNGCTALSSCGCGAKGFLLCVSVPSPSGCGVCRGGCLPRLVYGTHRTLPETGSHARPVPQPLHPQHPLATCGTTHPGRQPQHYGNRRAYRLQQFQLSQQMFPGNVRLPSLGICGENAEINLCVVPFQQDCCHLKGIQGYFCSIILKEP